MELLSLFIVEFVLLSSFYRTHMTSKSQFMYMDVQTTMSFSARVEILQVNYNKTFKISTPRG